MAQTNDRIERSVRMRVVADCRIGTRPRRVDEIVFVAEHLVDELESAGIAERAELSADGRIWRPR